ncbi:glycosyltransferase [Calycomorphotria hydatis]|uniref:Glycosyltransferase EpsF n=1 Tax=Calycomorphotria hydatis TaxID=2528027 RepID=A0A517T5X5_9PLAN|nr:glycosyltransferase [Calycomorphotria hydatis]QDT63785.1 Putative glycosyltransferase EpsF [Calycomorphotria hydatis]
MSRVLLVTPTLDASGAEKQLMLLARGLPRDEFEFEVLALTRGGPYEEKIRAAKIPVDILHKRWKLDPNTLMKLKQRIQSFAPDIVHSWMFTANSYCRLALPKQSRPKMLISERCVDTWKSGWQKWLDKKLMPRTDAMIANSESVAEHYRDFGFPAEKITVIPNGVEECDLDATLRAEVRSELGIPADGKVVGFIGRLAKQKRVEDLLWAVQLLKQLTEDVHMIFVGDGPLRPRLEQLAKVYECEHLTHFVGHQNDTQRYLSAMDVFWLGSEFEGMSNSLMEAMACGLPVVASDIPPNRELIESGVSGYLAPLGDAVAFAQFTQRIFAETNLATQLGSAAQSRMREQFTIPQMIERHIEVYRGLIATTG